MNEKRCAFRALVAASGFAMLLSSAAFAAPSPQERAYQYRADRISTQGEITSMSREGDRYRIELNHGSYVYYVPVSTVSNRDIRLGLRVRLGGFVSGDAVNADFIAFTGEPAYSTDPAYRGVPYGSS